MSHAASPSALSQPLRNLADAVRRSGRDRPGAPALIESDRARSPVTWSQLDVRVDAMAAALTGLGLPDGAGARARVAIVLPNVTEFAVSLFGTLRAGLVGVPLNPGYTARELRHLLADSGASVIIATSDVLGVVAGLRGELPFLQHSYELGEALNEFVDSGRGGAGPDGGGGEDLAVLLYTSGTAGAPKGAMLSHRSLLANHHQISEVDPPIVRADDVVLLALPPFHAFGLNSCLGAVAWHGACGVLVRQFDPATSLDVIARERVTVVTGVPQMYAAWSTLPDVASRMATVRLSISGAAPLDRLVARRFAEVSGHEIVEGYGLTETAPVLSTALASPVPKAGSIGRPIPHVDIKLVANDGSEIARVGPDGLLGEFVDDFDDDAGGVPGTDPGELVVRGPNLFSGYWPDGSGGPDQDGWWATGDVGYADEDGDLFLVDRLGELIIVNGFNVYPHEIELVLASQPGVAEAAAVGVPDALAGQAVKAYVVRVSDDAVTEEELMAHCGRNLARFKCPSAIEFVAELPHSATGKVRKGTLRAAS